VAKGRALLALLVLLAMADYADEQHVCYPSIGGLASKARLSQRQVVRILNGFKADGVIVPVGAKKSKHGRAVTIYRIAIETLAKGDTMSPYDAAKGDICANKVTPMSYDPSLDPSVRSIEDVAAAPTTVAADPDSAPTAKTLAEQPPIAIYRDAFLRYPSKAQMAWLMAQEITDLRRWLEVCQLWIGKGWSPTNLQGMIDLYRNPARIAELHTYRGANHETTTARRAATNTRATGGAGEVLASRQVGVNGAGANGYHGAAAGHAPATAFLIETDDDGADDEF
jgi:hypothetical protein